jgi:hypothetical protein
MEKKKKKKKKKNLFTRLRLEPATNVEISFSLCLLPHWNWVLQNNEVGTSPNKKRMIVFLLVIELLERTYSLGSVKSINATLNRIT